MAILLFTISPFSIALFFSVIIGLTIATPWEESVETMSYKAQEWSPRPTRAPEEPAKLFKRSSLDVAICGWLGGNKDLEARCASGSSCIHDTMHGVVGCCTQDGACQQGVYTTCLDTNSAGWLSTRVTRNDGVTMWYVESND